MKNNRVIYRDIIEHDHVYTDCGEDEVGLKMRASFTSGICPICLYQLTQYRHIPEDMTPPSEPYFHYIVLEPIITVCKKCGWWQSKAEGISKSHPSILPKNESKSEWAYSYHPVIDVIDISSNVIAINDLRNHLLKNWSDRNKISAAKAELLVQSLLKEHFKCDVFSATANVNQADGGIDLYVCHDNGEIKTAVQVKRRITKDVESVTEVRNFVGALLIENIKKGIFVTTAERYSSVAIEIPRKLNSRLELQLINGLELYEILQTLTPPNEIIIPPYVNKEMIWHDNKNSIYTLNEIFSAQ